MYSKRTTSGKRFLLLGAILFFLLAGSSTAASPAEDAAAMAPGSDVYSGHYTLLVSSSPDRSNPAPLNGLEVSGNIFVFTSPDTGVQTVRFYLDDPDRMGQPYQVENTAPFDFAGGDVTTPRPFDTTTVADGPHTITAAINYIEGGQDVIHADFTVNNSSRSLRFTPSSLSFAVLTGASGAKTTSLQTSDGLPAAYQVSSDTPWLTVSPENGTTPVTLTVVADASNLPAGTYNAAVTASAADYPAETLMTTVTVLADEPSGQFVKWHPVTIDFTGPSASETDSSPNPFLDYRLQVTFTSPTNKVYVVPGFYDGDGNGNGSGNIWRVRITPDEVGTWTYSASFRTGPNIAVDLNPNAGSPTGFNGTSGAFQVTERDPNAPGFLKWGRLEYVGDHYLKFRDGPYWIKGGTDSPETFLGYSGFDNTPAGPFGVLDYETHVRDWQPGDPDWGDGAGKGIIGVLNYFENQHVNSVYFLPMNIGGDGRNTWPYAGSINPNGSSANDNLHFDISKLHQWDIVFNHAQRKGVLLHFVLNEAEAANKSELDKATLGVERKLFYRELIARFGYINALEWNISEEYDLILPLSTETVKEFAGFIQSVDPFDHPITVHNNAVPEVSWTPFLGDPRFSITSFQLEEPVSVFDEVVEAWRTKTAAAGRPLPISLDEIRATTTSNFDAQRKEIIWPTYLSGGNLEYFIGGANIDKRLENFRPYETLWQQSWYARKFLEENVPFWDMEPNDSLLNGESTVFGGGQVFALPGSAYAIYIPDASPSGTLDLRNVSGTFVKRWYNPRTGNFEGTEAQIQGGDWVNLGSPPSDPNQDWAVLVLGEGVPGPPPPPPPGGAAVASFTLMNALTDEPIFDLLNGMVIDYALIGTDQLNIRANTNPPVVGSVRFGWNDEPNHRVENTAPYAFAGDTNGNYSPWTPSVGTHTIVATPYSSPDGGGDAGTSLTITFTIADGDLYSFYLPRVDVRVADGN